MDFWNTVLGNNLAHVLIQTLPVIANHFEKQDETPVKTTHQHVTITDNCESAKIDAVADIIRSGGRIVTISGNIIVYESSEEK